MREELQRHEQNVYRWELSALTLERKVLDEQEKLIKLQIRRADEEAAGEVCVCGGGAW